MSNLKNQTISAFKNMNKLSKFSIKYGSILILAVYIAAFLVCISAGKQIGYYTAMRWLDDLLLLGKELLGAVFVTSLLIEIAEILTGKKSKEETE